MQFFRLRDLNSILDYAKFFFVLLHYVWSFLCFAIIFYTVYWFHKELYNYHNCAIVYTRMLWMNLQ